MLKLSVLKYYLLYFAVVVYTFLEKYTNVITWETPSHISVIMNFFLGLGTAFFFVMVIFYLGGDQPSRKDSFDTFGNKKISQFWSLVYLPMFVYGIYAWTSVSMIAITGLAYFGAKVLISNHNKHAAKFKEEELMSRARQESAEKVTLP